VFVGLRFIGVMDLVGRLAIRTMLNHFERTYRIAQKRGDIESDEKLKEALGELEKDGVPPLM
jgi:hypothetical protein